MTTVDEDSGLDLALLGYPSAEPQRIEEVVSELLANGVPSLAFHRQASKMMPFLLGKGGRGLVFMGLREQKKVAVKVLRADAAVKTMRFEAENQRRANREGIGPLLYSWSSNVIVMQYVDGQTIGQIITAGPSRETKAIIDQTLEQTYILDTVHLDHGQLTNASDHVIVSSEKTPVIIDFSHSSQTRKPKNVTSFASYLIRSINPSTSKNPALIKALKDYKQNKSRTTFEALKHAIDQGLLKTF
ncbi:MAG: hypothetical protein NZ956_00675 [Candidatus Caldarchaeum sp.]|nr:hypothetical protein [Candidatus Caldarchaeum sp.]